MTQHGQGICFMERGINPGSNWFSDESLSVHSRIADSKGECPRIDLGSLWGARGEQPRIVTLRKTVVTQPKQGCIVPYDRDERHRLMHAIIHHGEPGNHMKRSDSDRVDSIIGPGELDAASGYPHFDPPAFEVIQSER